MAQATVALENAWNFREALVRQQLEKELNLAAAIQRDLFPKSMPVLPGTELAARNRQARAVGGDYYDALSWGGTNDEHLFVVIDISGKGIYASLLMANIQATLRALLGESNSLPRIAARANDLLHASTPSNKYATAIMARYDPHTGRGEYVNGGHNDGILLRASGEVELLTTTGLPVGLFPKREFDSKPFHLGHGDILFLYSDGVPDACKLNEEEFGMDRLVEVLRSQASEPLETLIDRLFHDIDKFVEGAPQHDDITMLVVRRTGN
jgi:sigma-B regulation protein RsbU (phosphoserine phosphatase)